MNLHNDKAVFQQALVDTSAYMKFFDASIVEKDYFITCFLQGIAEKHPDVVFRGGTSLSKCHRVINRFSEDIDLSLCTGTAKPTEGQRKLLKQSIISIIDNAGFTLENPEQVHSRREFNRYVIDYHSYTANPYLKQFLIVETTAYIKAFPTQPMPVTSFVYDFLNSQAATETIRQYELEPFLMQVQSIERTFIDKVFALGDYFLSGTTANHSRHIYDLYKLYPKIAFDETFFNLVKEVRAERKSHITCLSAQDSVDLPEILQKIVDDDIYEADYNQSIRVLLFEDVPYSEAVAVIRKILGSAGFA